MQNNQIDSEENNNVCSFLPTLRLKVMTNTIYIGLAVYRSVDERKFNLFRLKSNSEFGPTLAEL